MDRVEAALWRDAWRRFRRGSGNPLTLITAGAALWAADYLTRRSAPGVRQALGDRVPALPAFAVALLALACLALAWRRLFGTRAEATFLATQPIAPHHLRRLWLTQIAAQALLPALLLGAALRRLHPDPASAWHHAALPLAALPACAAIAVAVATALAALAPTARAALTATSAAALIAAALHLPTPPSAWIAALAAALPTTWLAARAFDGWRARLAASRHASNDTLRVGRSPLATLLAPLPRRTRALVLTDLRFVLRGGHLNGLALTPLLLALPAAYLVWPLPDDVAQAPLLVGAMLSTFATAGLGYVLGPDLARAETPYLPLRRLSPCPATAIWWSRVGLALAAGLTYAGLFAGALALRHGADGLEFWPPLAALSAVVPVHAAALGLAADSADVQAAGAIATSAAVIGVLTLIAWQVFPPLILLYPITLRGARRRALARYRQMEVA